jgi:hypothetical protein
MIQISLVLQLNVTISPENLTEYGADRAINVKLQRNKLKQLVQFCVQIYPNPEIHCYH